MSAISALSILTRRLSSVSLLRNAINETAMKAASTGTVPHPTNLKSYSSSLSYSVCTINSSSQRFQSTKSNKDDGSTDGGVDKKEKGTTNYEISDNAEWVKFQQKIQVRGFDTGQQTTLSNQTPGQMGKKRRGGKTLRKRIEKQQKEQNIVTTENVQLGGGHFPALRFSKEETARLLQEAYEGIPSRDGKRGSRNLKRQRLKARNTRKYNTIKKKEIMAVHSKKMEKRSQKVKDIRTVYEDAPSVREQDQLYQQEILERWSQLGLAQKQAAEVQGRRANHVSNFSSYDDTMIEGEVIQKEIVK